MAKPHQRAVALIFAVLFFATAVGGSLFFIWQIYQEREASNISSTDSSSSELAQQQLQEAINNQQQEQDVAKLEGTKLEGFTPVKEVSSLQIIDLVEGTGEEVEAGASVTAHYTGAIADSGIIFQSSKDFGDEPVEFSLDRVIAGWTQGVPGMKVGGTRRLIIPTSMAYGDNPDPNSIIQPGDHLVFDIELTAVTNP